LIRRVDNRVDPEQMEHADQASRTTQPDPESSPAFGIFTILSFNQMAET